MILGLEFRLFRHHPTKIKIIFPECLQLVLASADGSICYVFRCEVIMLYNHAANSISVQKGSFVQKAINGNYAIFGLKYY